MKNDEREVRKNAAVLFFCVFVLVLISLLLSCAEAFSQIASTNEGDAQVSRSFSGSCPSPSSTDRFAPTPANPTSESDYSDIIAKRIGGEREVTLWDGSRADIVTDELAIEVDWAPKWQQAIGQALYYGIMTGKRPAIYLLVRDQRKELKYVLRCQVVCAKYDIELRTYRAWGKSPC